MRNQIILTEAKIKEYNLWAKIVFDALLDFYSLPKISIIDFNYNGYACYTCRLNGTRDNIDNIRVTPEGFQINIRHLVDIWNDDDSYNNSVIRFGESKTFKSFLIKVFLHEIGHYNDSINNRVDYVRREAQLGAQLFGNYETEKIADTFSNEHKNEAGFLIKEVLRGV